MRLVSKLILLIFLVLFLLGAAPPVNQDYGVLPQEALKTYETVLNKIGWDVKLYDGFVVGKLKGRVKGTATTYVRGHYPDTPACWWIFKIKVKNFRVIAVTRFPGIPPDKWWI